MKILAVSDFDNGFPKGLASRLKKEKPDLILAGGDFCYGHKIRKAMFVHYDSDEEWHDIVGRRKAAKMMRESVKQGDKILKFLNSFNIPVLLVFGNHDKTGAKSRSKKVWPMYKKDLFAPLIKKYKNIFSIDLAAARVGNYYFVGYGQNCSAPELPVYAVQREKASKSELLKQKKKFKLYLHHLNKLFKIVVPKKTIFLVHNVPFNTKLDKITSRQAPKSVQGKHFGSIVARKAIEKHKPLLCVGGHMHEGRGIDKIGRTICVNDGPGAEGRYAMIEIKNSKIKVKLK